MAVANRMGMRQEELLPRLIKNVIAQRVGVGQILEGCCRGKGSHRRHDRVPGLSDTHGFRQVNTGTFS